MAESSIFSIPKCIPQGMHGTSVCLYHPDSVRRMDMDRTSRAALFSSVTNQYCLKHKYRAYLTIIG